MSDSGAPKQPVRQNKVRRNAESLRRYGRNPRQVWHEYPAVKARLVYACNLLFNGDAHEFAAAVGVCYRHFYRVLYGHSRLSVSMAAQIVTKTGIRAEWLLSGAGDICSPAAAGEHLVLPPRMQSSFRLFDAAAHNPGTEFFPAELISFADAPVSNLQSYEAAGISIYAAHSNQKPVGFFLGSEIFAAPAAHIVAPFFDARYADFLVLTLAAAAHDIQATHPEQPIDINSVARFAAARGIGYGEALGLVGLNRGGDRSKSLLATVLDKSLPAVVAVEIGELGRHTSTPVRGAETGAAIGAAAYTDLFVYTEQLRNFFGNPGGVMIVAGDCVRGVRLFLARLESLKLVEPAQSGFTFVLFSKPDDTLQTEIQLRGGHVIFLDPPTITTISQLFQTCNDVYAGKINHERRTPYRDSI
jgi:hypothetical protein